MDINITQVTMFEFFGLTNNKGLILFLFVLFLVIYMVTIVANVGMMVLVQTFSSLHTPMYYFLTILSLVDLLYSTVVTPKALFDLLSPKKTISFVGCALQFYFFAALASNEAILLSTMSYDRYVAICHPLHYILIMTKKKCFALVLFSSSLTFSQSIIQTTCVFSLSFCGSNIIEHFYCDIPPLLKLSCSDNFRCEMVTAIIVAACGIYTVTTVVVSYTFIISSISRMTSAQGRQKAFSTCSSHVICVSTFFTAVFSVYLRPRSEQDKVASVFYTIVTPMLNPLIYSLRNQEVKKAMWKLCRSS
ncbi:olfactory receptor 5B21-like [Gastrophryne carolinensis]